MVLGLAHRVVARAVAGPLIFRGGLRAGVRRGARSGQQPTKEAGVDAVEGSGVN